MSSDTPTLAKLSDIYHNQGARLYFGEPITVSEHSLQTARLAEAAGASDRLVAAALLHDIGHMLHGKSEDIAHSGTDSGHEIIGGNWLAKHFELSIATVVSLHVPAKRFMCFRHRGYISALSAASRQSLAIQGGVMTEAEAQEFRAQPLWRDAVELRLWDDEAKIPGQRTRPFESYLPLLEAFLTGE